MSTLNNMHKLFLYIDQNRLSIQRKSVISDTTLYICTSLSRKVYKAKPEQFMYLGLHY